MTAAEAPKATTYRGVKGANVIPKSIPVTTPETSVIELYFLKNTMEKSHSETNALATDVIITRTGAIPYTAYAAIIEGINAKTTSDITFATLSFTLICGV